MQRPMLAALEAKNLDDPEVTCAGLGLLLRVLTAVSSVLAVR